MIPPRHRHRRATSTCVTSVAATLALTLTLSLVIGFLLLDRPGGAQAMAVANAGFEDGSAEWIATGAATELSSSDEGRNATRALRITSVGRGEATAESADGATDGSAPGTSYLWTVWMRSGDPGLRGRLKVGEHVDGQALQTEQHTVRLVRGLWTRLEVVVTRQQAGSLFGVHVGSLSGSSGDALLVDDVRVLPLSDVPLPTTVPSATAAPTRTSPSPTAGSTTSTPSRTPASPTTASPTTPSPTARPATGDAAGPMLSNGCATTRRGIPLCGAYLGSAYGSNSDPAPMEEDMNRRLGVRRTYFRSDQVDAGVRNAAQDLAAGRLPWISFKLPHSWLAMEAGRGDAWARDLAGRLAALPGPVWVAFHHEPEGDGDIQSWRRMQERLAPIVRRAAPNVAYTVVLTGWNQLYGDEKYDLDAIFPRVEVDLAGFDVYNQYGVVKDGTMNTEGTNLRTAYFEPISRWAASRGVAWGIAETGFTDRAAAVYPDWIAKTYTALRELDGVAFTYFNTTLNSVANWELSTPSKRDSYRDAAVGSPVLPPA